MGTRGCARRPALALVWTRLSLQEAHVAVREEAQGVEEPMYLLQAPQEQQLQEEQLGQARLLEELLRQGEGQVGEAPLLPEQQYCPEEEDIQRVLCLEEGSWGLQEGGECSPPGIFLAEEVVHQDLRLLQVWVPL